MACSATALCRNSVKHEDLQRDESAIAPPNCGLPVKWSFHYISPAIQQLRCGTAPSRRFCSVEFRRWVGSKTSTWKSPVKIKYPSGPLKWLQKKGGGIVTEVSEGEVLMLIVWSDLLSSASQMHKHHLSNGTLSKRRSAVKWKWMDWRVAVLDRILVQVIRSHALPSAI